MLKILKDTDKNGKAKDWQKEKLQSFQLAKYLDRVGYHNQAKQIRECCSTLMFAENDYNRKLKKAFFCHNKLCPMCLERLAILNYEKLKNIMNYLHNDATYKRGYQYIFVTLSTKNVKASKLKNEYKKYVKAIPKMFRYVALKPYVVGKAQKIEITYNKISKDYNLHVHFLILAKSKIVNSHKRLKLSDWRKLWQRALKAKYKPVVKVSELTTYSDALRTAKYITKATNYVEFLNQKNIKNKLKVINALYQAFRYHSSVIMSGIFRQINKIIYDATSMVKTGYSKQERFKPDHYSFYKWNNQHQNMLLNYQVDISIYEKAKELT